MVVTVEAKGTREPGQMQAVYLEKLADELSHRGLEAWLMAPPGRRPSLYVVNPAARALEENVYAGCGQDGIWWFWLPDIAKYIQLESSYGTCPFLVEHDDMESTAEAWHAQTVEEAFRI